MQAWSPGGLSLVPDSEFVSGALAGLIVENGGVADFDAIELRKKLAGKSFRVGSYISDLSEGFTGSASPKDLETMLQLLYLRATAPRRDSSAFEALRAQFNTILANRENQPEVAFQDTIDVTMAQHHPRARPLDTTLLATVRLNRAYDIYRDRFADVSDMTVTFVGNVTPDSLRPLVERWLGGLPTSGRHEQWHDVGIRPPAAAMEKIVRKGTEPKASTVMFFTGEAPYTPESRYALRSLCELLDMKMLETMREALGGTYSVSVSPSGSKYPVQDYQVMVNFGSAPDKVDTLYRSAMAIIDSVKRNGVSDADVQKVREQEQRTQEVSLKQNSWWASNISGRIQNGEDPRGLVTYENFIRNLTGDQIRQAAIKYLDPARLIRFVLLPEKVVQ